MGSWAFEWVDFDSARCWEELWDTWTYEDFKTCLQLGRVMPPKEGGAAVEARTEECDDWSTYH